MVDYVWICIDWHKEEKSIIQNKDVHTLPIADFVLIHRELRLL